MSEGACFHEKRLKENWDLFDPTIQTELGSAQFFTATDYIKANRIRTILQHEMAEVFTKCDVMIVPGTESRPAKIDSPAEARAKYRDSAAIPPRRGNTSIGNMTGNPSLVVPCGMFSAPDVFPIAMMLYGKPFDEMTLYRVANAYESATDWHRKRPPMIT